MLVPDPVAAFTVTTKVKFAVVLAAKLEIVQVSVASVQVQPEVVLRETAVVLAGRDSVKLTVVAAAGPLFRSLCLYVTLLPGETEVGEAELVVTKSAWDEVATTSAAVAALLARFGSEVEDVTVAVLLITVPAAVPVGTFKTTEKLAVPAAKLALVQLMVPVEPAAGVIALNVVPVGVVSVKLTVVAVLGPRFLTLCE